MPIRNENYDVFPFSFKNGLFMSPYNLNYLKLVVKGGGKKVYSPVIPQIRQRYLSNCNKISEKGEEIR